MHLTEEEQSEEQRKDFDPTPSRSRDVSGGNLMAEGRDTTWKWDLTDIWTILNVSVFTL